MKFEDSFLTTYLVNNLQPLTEADPLILAEYVAALLKKDKPIKELEKLCAEKLLEFLGQGTQSFITKLFQALGDRSFVGPARSSDAIEQVETSATRFREDPTETVLKRSALNTEEFSPSGCPSDQEEKEVTDDDDDDRNHKHRRRDNQSHSSDKDVQGQQLRRPNRKRNRPFENGHTFLANDPQPSENRKEYNPSFLEQRKRPGLAPSLRPYDIGLRTRTNQAFHGDPGSHFDISTSLGRIPTGRGRGRCSIPWSQSDLKFSSADTYDFSSQMGPQGPTLFAGRGMQSLGLSPGMPDGNLDTLLPLGLQTSMNQPFNIAMPRQRCGDFEERGFCLRGDMCPMEHGVNRIVVEDVQSLSQFNLPVSLPSAHLLGTPAGSGALSSTSGPSSLMTNSKTLLSKSSKPGVTDDGPGLNRELSTSAAAAGADLYDPDQPLWNNDHPERSSALMGLSSPPVDDAEPLWNADPSGRHIFRLSDGVESEHRGRSITSTVGSQTTTSSIWERIGNPRNRVDMTAKIDSNASMGYNENETKEQDESLSTIPGATHQSKQIVSEDVGPKAVTFASVLRLRIDPARNSGRTTQKALRTLFINCIPQKNNKKEALFSHFRKFGEVIDIYIPQNSERAFVQFSKREEAEAALKAPDAVMGNRFIKLWWANRDSIPDNSISTSDTSSAAPSVSASVPAQAINGSGRKESLPAVGLKITAASSSEVPVPTVHPKSVLMNSPRVILPSQKKLENLELMKEELRLKQELLDQKRNDFRRHLDKLEKQAITVTGEETAAQTAKRQKPVMPKPMNPVTAGHRPGAEKTLDKTHSGENIESPSSKTNSTVVLQSPMSFKHQTRPSVQLGVPFVVNRFKLDNRPSTFKILPLPADLANVGALREHFSAFGDLSAVELEDSEANAGTKSSEPQKSISARVTFTTRGSAEKAFLNGKNWQGHSLKFSWLTVSNNSSSDHSGRESFPTLSLRSPPDAEGLAESATFRSSSDMGKSTCIDSEAPASTGNPESKNPEARMGDVEHVDVSITCQSSHTNPLSCEMPS